MENNIDINLTSSETVFKIVKTTILKDMPTGMLVTKHTPTFDFGFWDHKSYDSTTSIRDTLKSKWCSTVINHFIFDIDTTPIDIQTFIESNLYEIHWRHSYLIYCLSIPSKCHKEADVILQSPRKFMSDTYSNKIFVGDYCVYVNDFVKNIILL